MKNELKNNLIWVSGILFLILAAIFFVLNNERITLLPGLDINPHVAAISLTGIGIYLIIKGSKNLIQH
jgi:uncharacterized integral membrane protein